MTRAGSRRCALAGSVRRTAVTSPVDWPERCVSIARTSSRAAISARSSGWRFSASLAVAFSSTAASALETSGRRAWTSGSCSRTCFIATATWFSPLKGTSPVSISNSTMPSE